MSDAVSWRLLESIVLMVCPPPLPSTTLDGRNGLAGWRWLFIIDALITIPVAV